ncbi:MAG: phosphoenolpyruvate--protein phosphotransferase [Gemmatimonadaceae bacterium]
MSQTFIGVPASPGIVVGPAYLLRWEVPDVRHRIVSDEEVEGEVARLHAALARARERLVAIRVRTETHAGADEAAIFDVQHSILEDTDLIRSVEALIRQNVSAEKAFDLVMLDWRQHFARHQAPMMRERVGDLTDVHIRVLSTLLGLPDHDPVDVPKGANAILVTHDLTPSITVQLDREAIAAIATDAGTRTSHVAILARSLGIPAVVGLRDVAMKLRGHERVILDGSAGHLVVDPSAHDVERYGRIAVEQLQDMESLQAEAAEDAITLDGVPVILRANVDLPDEAEAAASSGASGGGLRRTEFLVVGRALMPDEEEQYRAYRRVVEAFPGEAVIIRTFDIGGDKLPMGGHPVEANPFLGWRAIRMCLDQPELFKTQLRALLRAAVHGDVRIMLPLVVSVAEVQQTRVLLAESAAELSARGVAHRLDVPVGMMVETPAAAVSVDSFVGEVDFLSIGTNDLTQYTLAVDRGNVNLASRYTPLHPAVLRLIREVVRAADRGGVDVGVCGEMASQPLMAYALVGLGVRQLSVSPRAVPLMKRVLRGIRASEASEAAAAAMMAPTADAVEAELVTHLELALGDVQFLRLGLPQVQRADTIRG